MGDARRAICKDCNGHRDDVGVLSWRGYCSICGPKRAEFAADDLHYHRGPYFERWRVNIAASVGAVLPEKPLSLDTERT